MVENRNFCFTSLEIESRKYYSETKASDDDGRAYYAVKVSYLFYVSLS